MFDYKLLEDSVKDSDVLEDFRMVNKQIDVMLLNDDDKIEKIKALICHYEGKLNKSNTYTAIAISYALIIGACSAALNFYGKFLLFIIIYASLLIPALYISIITKKISRTDYKITFILKALYFKLEKYNNDVKTQQLKTVRRSKKSTINTRRK